MPDTHHLRKTVGPELPRRVRAGESKAPRSVSHDAQIGAGPVTEILRDAVIQQFKRERCRQSGFPQDVTALNEISDRSRSDLTPNLATESDAAAAGASEVRAPDLRGERSIPGWKRALDLGIILLLSPLWLPLMLVIMLGIKVSSVGPVFYKQERVGYKGRRFLIYKFRTMKLNVETRVHESHFEQLMQSDSPMTKLDANGDPRLISCGRFVRAAGLDELPQIFNVLRGEMSLVGPRPCTVHEFERYQPWQRERVNGPPGLTGYWQVNGKNKTTFSEMIAMDIFYSKNMCLLLDLAIMFRTIPAVLSEIFESHGGSLVSAWKHRFRSGGEAVRTPRQQERA